jgi:hypothetical protein
MIRFRVNGHPAPQGSKRHVGGGRMVESSRAVGPWREAVRADVVQEICRMDRENPGCLAGLMYRPVWVLMTFALPRPKAHYGTGRNAGQVKPSAPTWTSSPAPYSTASPKAARSETTPRWWN